MTSQRWTRIRPPISPLPHHLHLPVSPGPQQTGCQVALPALPKVLPLIPLPPSALFTHTHIQTHTPTGNALSFMPTIFHLLNPISILSSLARFVSLAHSPSPLIQKRPTPSFQIPSMRATTPLSPPPLYPDHPWQPSSFCRQRE